MLPPSNRLMATVRLVLPILLFLGLLPARPFGDWATPLYQAAPQHDLPQQVLTVLREARDARRARRNRAREKKALAAFLLAGGARAIEAHPCMEHSGINPLYILPHYFGAFRRDEGRYTNLIVGDSTATISALVPGFLQSGLTRSIGVPGNRLCHMLITLGPSAHGGKVDAIVVMTLGGNDLLAGLPRATIEEDLRALRQGLRKRYPRAKLVGVGVHPVRLGLTRNLQIERLNERARPIWMSDEPACFVDPKGLFTTDETGQPAAAHFLPNDPIHYESAIALGLRKLVAAECAVEL